MRSVKNYIVGAQLYKKKVLLYFQFSSPLAVLLSRWYARVFAAVTLWFGRPEKSFSAVSSCWRRYPLALSNTFVQKYLAQLPLSVSTSAAACEVRAIAKETVNEQVFTRLVQSVKSLGADAQVPTVFGHRLIMLAPPRAGEKGVLVVKFTNYFVLFFEIFSPSIFKDFHVVLEPSWVGYFDASILLFEQISERVFVQGIEERDLEFIRSRNSNLVGVPLAANHWVNPQAYYPIPGTEKIYDVIFVAMWADFKCHCDLFAALKKLGDSSIRVACAGLTWERTLKEIQDEAMYYGVHQQIDFFEGLTPAELNVKLNQSRASLVLSHKEGSNKAIIESFFADVPGFLPEGFNYGTKYSYINGETGGFFAREELPELLAAIHANRFSGLRPRAWAESNMGPEVSTKVLEQIIFGDVRGRLKVKVNQPELLYLHDEDKVSMGGEYQRLKQYLRSAL